MVNRRNPNRITEPQGIEFINFHFQVFAVHLIDCYHYRLSGSSEHIGNSHIIFGNASSCIHYKQNDVCFFHGQFSLFSDAIDNLISLISEFNAARINHRKFLIQPAHITVNAVSGNAWNIFYDRYTTLCKPVQQSGLTNIWSPYYGNKRFAHFIFLSIRTMQTESVCTYPNLLFYLQKKTCGSHRHYCTMTPAFFFSF